MRYLVFCLVLASCGIPIQRQHYETCHGSLSDCVYNSRRMCEGLGRQMDLESYLYYHGHQAGVWEVQWNCK